MPEARRSKHRRPHDQLRGLEKRFYCPHQVIEEGRHRMLGPQAELWVAVMDRLLDDTRNAAKYAERAITHAKKSGGNVMGLRVQELRELAAFWETTFALEELCDRLNSLGVDRFRAVEIRKALAPAVDALPGLCERYGLDVDSKQPVGQPGQE
jgi:hypothetical protein